jgi:hypothetical protein
VLQKGSSFSSTKIGMILGEIIPVLVEEKLLTLLEHLRSFLF